MTTAMPTRLSVGELFGDVRAKSQTTGKSIFKKVREAVAKLRNPGNMTFGGFALLSASAWTINLTLGLAAAGTSLLLLAILTDKDGAK